MRHVSNEVTTRTINLLAFLVHVARFIIDKVEKRPMEKVEIKGHRNISAKATVGLKTVKKDELQTQKTDLERSFNPLTGISSRND